MNVLMGTHIPLNQCEGTLNTTTWQQLGTDIAALLVTLAAEASVGRMVGVIVMVLDADGLHIETRLPVLPTTIGHALAKAIRGAAEQVAQQVDLAMSTSSDERGS